MRVGTAKRAIAMMSAVTLLAFGLSIQQPISASAAACGSGSIYSSGSGTEADPYLIDTKEHLIYFAANDADWADEFLQTSDIDLEGCDWTPIGGDYNDYFVGINQGFTGVYDGGGNSISGLSVNDDSTLNAKGMFGFLNGTVKDLNLVDVEISGEGNVGGLAGWFSSGAEAERVTVSGTVSGPRSVGGLVGHFEAGSIVDSYSTATVTARDWDDDLGFLQVQGIAGLVGQFPLGSIENTYSKGVVSDASEAGVTDSGGLTARYSGSGGSATSSFWDTQSSGQSSSSAGTGKTTAEMTSFSSFDDAGWDIVDGWEAYDFDNPTNEWGICSGANGGYPFLLWQFSEDPCSVDSGGSTQQTSSTGDSDPGAPGIYLTVKGRSGDTASGSLIGFGGFAVAPNAPYLLTLRPVQEGAAQTVLARGVMNSGGHLEDEVTVGVLASGSHEIVFVSRDRAGSLLTLANVVVVNRDGRFQSITPEEFQPRVR